MTKAEIMEILGRRDGAADVMDTAQVAQVLGITDRMVRIYARQGRLEGRKDRSGHCIYTLEAVAGFVMENHHFLASPESTEAARLARLARRTREKMVIGAIAETTRKELEGKRRRTDDGTEEKRIMDELDYSGMSDEEAETRREAARIVVYELDLKEVEAFITHCEKNYK